MPNVYFKSEKLLEAPVERAAFSDRMCYVCAELSKLAYFKFEGGHPLDQAEVVIDSFIKDEEKARGLKDGLALIISQMPGTEDASRHVLEDILRAGGFALADIFSYEGTQAFLCTRDVINRDNANKKKVAYLVFRGTEPKDFRDIKADMKARLKKVKVGNEALAFHTGFYNAYALIEDNLKKALTELKYDQLFITGHSLSGALAMMATRLLPFEIKGACYTYGAPPIGTIEIQNGLKTPVYEIVNETDIVPLLPNAWAAWAVIIFLNIAKLALRPFVWLYGAIFGGEWDERFVEYMKTLTLYEHPGYKSYLIGTPAQARLRFQISGYARLKMRFSTIWKQGFGGFKKMAGDHSIDLYVEKIRSHAERRN